MSKIPGFKESADAYKEWTGEEMGKPSDLISRAELLEYATDVETPQGYEQAVFVDDINNLPSVSAERVGEWELCKDIDGEYGICSVCGNDADFSHYGKPYHYCPNCGARMGNDDDDLDGLKIIAIIDGKGGAE